ncbi:hypothetical protein DICPUDRAFT_159367 [Dictyostelium purpureum]|uniref:NELF-A N-terminal domain-containing protein n=1 Tax=Dictyostelium purpureum TaxID=5786 RepID=F1A3Y2_DICPU|nr:uncharacterized protein DICPUDRAFT_159367 [Dictyostelium purpureum]EGC29099.1 hypothetical protein DICPUDRAFT_159367 [Dictyostelium purpureum]|eukprot:XP_003294374.1 hypothetical protein DICPUDRAFT_159367 [Dictyostelium purpureum]
MSNEHRDIEGWLASKLEEPWSSERLSSLLSKDILQLFFVKFTKIDTLIRIKVLFSFLFLKKKQFQELEQNIVMLLQIAQEEEDEWLQVMGQLLRKINEEKISLTVDLQPFTANIKRLNQLLEEKGSPNFYPLENLYLNKSLIPVPTESLVVHNHFKLKKQTSELLVFTKKSSNQTLSTPSLSASKSSIQTPTLNASTNSLNQPNQSNHLDDNTNIHPFATNIPSMASINEDDTINSNIGLESPTLKNERIRLNSSGLNTPTLRRSNLFIPKSHHGQDSNLSSLSSISSPPSMLNNGGHHHMLSSSGGGEKKFGAQKKTKMAFIDLDQSSTTGSTTTTTATTTTTTTTTTTATTTTTTTTTNPAKTTTNSTNSSQYKPITFTTTKTTPTISISTTYIPVTSITTAKPTI